mmetsp:Transcript_34164/g.85757  ORF Transcript_34164/g.85757 Transcript_34164/m.85757 type:complete len:90 (+) Transcript_34164:392-661(+)
MLLLRRVRPLRNKKWTRHQLRQHSKEKIPEARRPCHLLAPQKIHPLLLELQDHLSKKSQQRQTESLQSWQVNYPSRYIQEMMPTLNKQS